MIILVLLGTIAFFVLQMIISLRKKKLIPIVGALLIGVTFFGWLFQDILKKRFYEIKTEINKPIEGLYFNSTNIRVAILSCSLELIEDMPFIGYGKDLKEELNDCYANNYNSDFYKYGNYNTHNYYLNLILYGGWLFLLLFLFYIYHIFRNKKHSTFALLFIAQILIINLTENFLSRHYGIITFNYFIVLLIFFEPKSILRSKELEKETHF